MREKTKGKRYGFCEYELPSKNPFSRWEAREDFFNSIDRIEPKVALSLFAKAFHSFIALAWFKFPKAIPEPIRKNRSGKTNLSDEELYLEIMKTSIESNPEIWLNYSNQMPLTVLLSNFERFPVRKIVNAFPSWAALKKNPLASELCSKIQEWSEEWNLNEDWCRDFAVTALCVWIQDKWARWDNHHISFQGAIPIVARKHFLKRVNDYWFTNNTLASKFKQMIIDKVKAERFEFKFRHIEFKAIQWNPFGMTRRHWKEDAVRDFQYHLLQLKRNGIIVPQGILTKFRKQVDSYLSLIDEVPKQVGINKSPRRWARQHFDWAVQFQVKKYSTTDIVKLNKKSISTISEGINGVWDFIGLKRRPELPSGMPKGTRIHYRRRTLRN